MPPRRSALLQLFAFLAAWAVVVVARLVQVQLVRHDDYSTRAQRQQERTLALNPVRGSILDCARARSGGERLRRVDLRRSAGDRRSQGGRASARADRRRASADARRDREAKLAADGGFVWIARQLPLEVGRRGPRLKLPGIYFLEEHRRSYPRGMLAANVIGYVGVDGEGLARNRALVRLATCAARAGKVTLLRDARRGMYLVGGEGANRPHRRQRRRPDHRLGRAVHRRARAGEARSKSTTPPAARRS